MRLVYKGIYKSDEQLPRGELPENAVKFKEPDNLRAASWKALLFVIPSVLLMLIFIIASNLLHGYKSTNLTIIGTLLGLLAIAPHEYLHAVFFPKDAEVELYISPKHLSAFVVSAHPISKSRFIMLSLFPSLLFGWIPLVIWMVLPYCASISQHLFSFATIGILGGVGDYMNVFNAARQMPQGSIHQSSGFNSYWYMPQKDL